MCGIIGFAGSGRVRETVGRGLEMLQYRGYDSCGYALGDGSALTVRRLAGKSRVAELVGGLPELVSRPVSVAAHTRWATHGPPTERNAHPVLDCRGEIAVVHNGIVENHALLREGLLARGHLFRTETDTEVIAHLLEEEYARAASLPGAVRAVARLLEGNFAFLALAAGFPGLAGARHGSPLMVASGTGGAWHVSSDINSLPESAGEVFILEDGQSFTAGREVVFHDYRGENQARPEPRRRAGRTLPSALPDGETWMHREIMEQPAVFRETLESLAARWPGEKLRREAGRIERVIILGCGTSWHSGLVAEYMIEDLAGIPVEVEYASEFRYRNPVIRPGDLVVAVSQSGETADTLGALGNLGGRCRTMAVCNVRESAVTRLAGTTLLTEAGPEIGVASTKAFATQLAALYFLALSLAGPGGRSSGELLAGAEAFEACMVRLLASLDDRIEALSSRLDHVSNALFLGRGLHFPIALEGALKLKEISYIHAEGYPAAEMKHGPIALIDEKMPVVFLAVEDNSLPRVLSNMEEVRSRGGTIITVTDAGNGEIDRLSEEVIRVPLIEDEYLKPVLTVMPLQLLAYHEARRRGCDVDKPRNLAKSVTVE